MIPTFAAAAVSEIISPADVWDVFVTDCTSAEVMQLAPSTHPSVRLFPLLTLEPSDL